VCFILYNILLFNKYYIVNSFNYINYKNILISFAISILILIIANNQFMLILGWDILGVTSYFLVIFF